MYKPSKQCCVNVIRISFSTLKCCSVIWSIFVTFFSNLSSWQWICFDNLTCVWSVFNSSREVGIWKTKIYCDHRSSPYLISVHLVGLEFVKLSARRVSPTSVTSWGHAAKLSCCHVQLSSWRWHRLPPAAQMGPHTSSLSSLSGVRNSTTV